MEIVFWLAVGLVVYSYAVYPLTMLVVAKVTRSNDRRQAEPSAPLPRVVVVVAALNEERHIDARIRNVLAQDYPPELLSVFVGSDGSTDSTVALAEKHAGPRVRVFPFPQRRGKASVLNDLVAAATENVIVFTDANTEFHQNAIRALVARFADTSVGAVSGELRLHKEVVGDNEDGLYWNVETAIKVGESQIGGLLGANGGIYAIRRELYAPLRPDTIVDDFTVVMNIAVAGWRTVFEPTALAFEDVPAGIDQEFNRRVRIGIGNYQAFFRHPEYLLRTAWVRRFTYFSHKVLRWFTPHLAIVALLASGALAARTPYRELFALQVVGYVVLAALMFARKRVALPRVAAIPLFLFALNVAFLIAFRRYVSGDFSGQWRRTRRA